jgi:small GTP-binding protein
MLGDTNTGKTSLVLRFAEGHFRPNSRAPTVGAFFITKRLQVAGLTCKVQIWDTAGQQQFRVLGKMYYQNAAAAIICYDVSSRKSFEVMKQWLEEVQRNIPAGSIVICICACKSDLALRVVPRTEVEALGSATGALVMETSAKEDTNVALLYRRVTERVLEYQQQPGSRPIPVTPGAKMEGGRVVRAETEGSAVETPPVAPPTTPLSKQRRDKRTKVDDMVVEDPPKMCEPNMMMCGIIPTQPTRKDCVIL